MREIIPVKIAFYFITVKIALYPIAKRIFFRAASFLLIIIALFCFTEIFSPVRLLIVMAAAEIIIIIIASFAVRVGILRIACANITKIRIIFAIKVIIKL